MRKPDRMYERIASCITHRQLFCFIVYLFFINDDFFIFWWCFVVSKSNRSEKTKKKIKHIFFFISPYEGMDQYLKMLFKYVPTGMPSASFNSVIFKRHDLTHSNVYCSVFLLIIWIIILFFISYLYLIKKKYRKS